MKLKNLVVTAAVATVLGYSCITNAAESIAVNTNWLVAYTDNVVAVVPANKADAFVSLAPVPNTDVLLMGETIGKTCDSVPNVLTVNGKQVSSDKRPFSTDSCIRVFTDPDDAQYVYNQFYNNKQVTIDDRTYSALGFRQSVLDVMNWSAAIFD